MYDITTCPGMYVDIYHTYIRPTAPPSSRPSLSIVAAKFAAMPVADALEVQPRGSVVLDKIGSPIRGEGTAIHQLSQQLPYMTLSIPP
jgi:hypothetical protein